MDSWRTDQYDVLVLEKALAFIDGALTAARPFFALVATAAVHVPHVPPLTLGGRPVRGEAVSAHADMLVAIDAVLGSLIHRLATRGALNDTITVFVSDNGGLSCREKTKEKWGRVGDLLTTSAAAGCSYSSSAATGHPTLHPGLRGFKSGVFEGGHRVPMVVSWPSGNLAPPPGSELSDLVTIADLYPTLLDLAGVALPSGQALDAVSRRCCAKGRRGPAAAAAAAHARALPPWAMEPARRQLEADPRRDGRPPPPLLRPEHRRVRDARSRRRARRVRPRRAPPPRFP